MRIVRKVAAVAGRAFLALALVRASATSALACVRPEHRTAAIDFSFPDPDVSVRDGLFLDVRAGDGPAHRVQVDTGSVGLALAATAIPAGIARGAAASIRYSSDGKTLAGHIYRVPLTLIGIADDVRARTIAVSVLGVDRIACDRIAHPACEVAPGEADRVGVLGVGFGRRGSGADLADVLGVSERDVNPFLELTAMRAGTMARAYTIAADRIELGDASGAVPRASDVVTLVRDGKNWKPLPGCFSVNAVAQPCAGGTILVDTGVETAIFATPARASGPVTAGTRLGIAFTPALAFSFTATRSCDGDGLSCARWSHRRTYPTFANTSRRLLARVDYRFDDDCGLVTLAAAKRP